MIKQAVVSEEIRVHTGVQRKGNELRRKDKKQMSNKTSNQFISNQSKTDMWKRTRITKTMPFILQEVRLSIL